MPGFEEKMERLELIEPWPTPRGRHGTWTSVRVLSARRPTESARHRGSLGPEVVKQECVARTLEAQNEILNAEERAGSRPRKSQEAQHRPETAL